MLDLIDAWHYQEYLKSRHDATLAFYVGAMLGGKIRKVEQLCGEWENGQIMTTAQATAWREKQRKAAKKNGKKT